MADQLDMPDMQVLELESFEVPFPMNDEQQERYRRRFLTLLIASDAKPNRGGSGCVYKVKNPEGETFAMKRIEKLSHSAAANEASYRRGLAAQVSAFRKEFENQQRLSGLKGFPKLYGYGMADGEPLIVMEWVEGVTCTKARELRAADPQGKRVPPLIVAELGIALFDLISRFEYLDDSFAHRDISPNNIMLRTDTRPLEQQITTDSFDLCLIDFGSATLLNQQKNDPSFTTATNVVRKATPEYAPPEMLTNDLPNLDRLRQSALIDVYAISSVLYELLCGEAPYRLGKLREEPSSYYRYKLEHRIPVPASLHADMRSVSEIEHQPYLKKTMQSLLDQGAFDQSRFIESVNVVDQQLGHILLKALAVNQSERSQAWEMKDMLERFVKNYGENIERRYSGGRLIPFIDIARTPRPPVRAIPLAAPSNRATTVLRPANVPAVAGASITAAPALQPAEQNHSIMAPMLLTITAIVAIAVIFSAIIQNSPGTLTMLGRTVNGGVPIGICLLGSLAPAVVALPFYWLGRTSGRKLLSGTIALTIADIIVWMIVHSTAWVVSSVEPLCAICLMLVAAIETIGAWRMTLTKERP